MKQTTLTEICYLRAEAKICDIRTEYGGLILGWYGDWLELLENIPWNDEAVYHAAGFINRHNCHYWESCDNDPSITVGRMLARPKVTVCCGVAKMSISSAWHHDYRPLFLDARKLRVANVLWLG